MKKVLALFLTGISIASCQSKNTSQPVPILAVEAVPVNRELFVKCIVRNDSSEKQEYWTWICSYWDEWKTNSSEVTIEPWDCDKNFLSPKFLEPGQSQEWKLPLEFKNASPAKTVRFRLAFFPSMPDDKERSFYNGSMAVTNGAPRSLNPLQGPFWSNEIELTLPNKSLQRTPASGGRR